MSKALRQPDLFVAPTLPEGFRYSPDVIPAPLQRELVGHFETLPFKPFEFHGYLGNRRIVSFGWRYDYGARKLQQGAPLPAFLSDLRKEAGVFAGQPPDAFEQVLVTEYCPGAGIGWHRDKPEFGEVVAFSFQSPCTLRFRKSVGDGWERRNMTVAAGSAYILRGPARLLWQHSIPPVDTLRYSVTFRTLVTKGDGRGP